MAWLYKRTFVIYDGPHDSEPFFYENNANPEEGAPCLDSTHLYDFGVPSYTVDQYCVSMEELDDEYEDFRASHIRLNGGELFVRTEYTHMPDELLDGITAGASKDLQYLFGTACAYGNELSDLTDEFLGSADHIGLNEYAFAEPVDYTNTFVLDEEQLERFDLSRLYSFNVWFEKTEIDDELVKFISPIPVDEMDENYENMKEAADGIEKVMICEGEMKTKEFLVFSEEPDPDFEAIPIFVGDESDLEFDPDLTTMSAGYAVATTDSDEDDDEDFEEDEE